MTRLRRPERRRRAIAACIDLAHTDLATYDELADAGELRDHVIEAVDDQLEHEGAA